eukprot:c23795_g1_i1.p1 GENE.c23795_g1_i1~~c23795_g1_i1.p1  ORF type:complete len:122 (-),score=16.26 c23795_g1_i1:525-890(-)
MGGRKQKTKAVKTLCLSRHCTVKWSLIAPSGNLSITFNRPAQKRSWDFGLNQLDCTSESTTMMNSQTWMETLALTHLAMRLLEFKLRLKTWGIKIVEQHGNVSGQLFRNIDGFSSSASLLL